MGARGEVRFGDGVDVLARHKMIRVEFSTHFELSIVRNFELYEIALDGELFGGEHVDGGRAKLPRASVVVAAHNQGLDVVLFFGPYFNYLVVLNLQARQASVHTHMHTHI